MQAEMLIVEQSSVFFVVIAYFLIVSVLALEEKAWYTDKQ
jgi:hypothetical protein